MFDVRKRCALARSGIWTIDGRSTDLPAIAFVHTNRIKAPKSAKLVVSAKKATRAKLNFVDQGNVFSPTEEKGDASIMPDFPYPLSLKELDIEFESKTGGSDAVVVHFGREKPIQEALENDIHIFVVGNAVELIRHPRELADEMVRLRKMVGYGSILYLPGVASPSNLALLCYSGADILDSTRIIWESRSGHLLAPEGRLPGSLTESISFSDILNRNCAALQDELEKTIYHIRNGSLREFVEKRAVHDPWMIAALRHLDFDHYEYQEPHFSMTGPAFHANTKESLHRPDIIRFRNRIKERYTKPANAKILLLLPCSAKKPYTLSKTHSLYRNAIRESGIQSVVHEVIVTSPLGIVPRELELFYPAQSYDIPVTGHWSKDEISIVQEDLLDFLRNNKYDLTIAHLGSEKDFVCEVLEDCVSTSDGNPTSAKNLSKLKEELSGYAEGHEKMPGSQRKLEDMAARCIFQFGEGGESLVESAEVKGRYPNLKILSGGEQLGMFVQERGMISLTLDGAERISKQDAYCIQIDDFYLEGSLFAVGVTDADEKIRIGDDVVVRHGRDVRAVGSASMNWKEMVESERGEAAKIRHKKRE